MKAETLDEIIARGHALLGEERAALASGRFDRIEELTARKLALLDALEPAIGAGQGTRELRRRLEALIVESRRNEQLIGAARSGLSAARRRIEAIVATRRGAVAYAPDGSLITSKADNERRTNRA